MSTVTDPADKYGALLHAAKQLDDAQRKSIDLAAKRHALPIGSSRARVTTANANHANAAERRDKCIDALDRELRSLGLILDRTTIAIDALKRFGFTAQLEESKNPSILLVTITKRDGGLLDEKFAADVFAKVADAKLVGLHTDGSFAFDKTA